MARVAAKSRAKKGGRTASAGRDQDEADGPILVAAGSEIAGLILIGLSLLATLALATYAPEDPIAKLVEVRVEERIAEDFSYDSQPRDLRTQPK